MKGPYAPCTHVHTRRVAHTRTHTHSRTHTHTHTHIHACTILRLTCTHIFTYMQTLYEHTHI